MPGWSRSAARWPRRGTGAANIITDYRTPDRLRFGLPPLTTRFTDVWMAVTATRDIIETERCENHG